MKQKVNQHINFSFEPDGENTIIEIKALFIAKTDKMAEIKGKIMDHLFAIETLVNDYRQ